MFSFSPFASHVPPSDPPIPPTDACLFCGKQSETLKKCSACKVAKFCSRDCQKAAWIGGKSAAVGEEKGVQQQHNKAICAELADRNQPNMLPYQVRVIRHQSGAYVENPDDIPAGSSQNAKKAPSHLSDCARDHYNVVQNLTTEQLQQRYPLACIERWGKNNMHTPHQDSGDEDDEYEPGTVALEAFLNGEDYEDCIACGSDGQQFFSFCLNRPVNSNMVHHCEFCHRCFYFQPGGLRGCAYCGMGYYFDADGDVEQFADAAGLTLKQAAEVLEKSSSSEIKICYAPGWRGTKVPAKASYFSRGLAAEGYWGW